MELLAKEDGWNSLHVLAAEELFRARPAVLAALDHVL